MKPKLSPYVFPGIHTPLHLKSDHEKAQLIIDVVCRHYNVTFENVCKIDRHREVREARQVIMHMTSKLTRLTLKAIARLFVHRPMRFDHSTVIHACKNVQAQLDVYSDFEQQYDNIMSKIIVEDKIGELSSISDKSH